MQRIIKSLYKIFLKNSFQKSDRYFLSELLVYAIIYTQTHHFCYHHCNNFSSFNQVLVSLSNHLKLIDRGKLFSLHCLCHVYFLFNTAHLLLTLVHPILSSPRIEHTITILPNPQANDLTH